MEAITGDDGGEPTGTERDTYSERTAILVPERVSQDATYRTQSKLLTRDSDIRRRTPTYSSNYIPPQHSVHVKYPSAMDLTNIQRVSNSPGAIVAAQQLCGDDLLVFRAFEVAHLRPTTNATKFGQCEH
ncbi:uncharacterized protein PHALS_05832 [Plasmopara halstedii]|uniref:Uncharacterized protein n=1 Tax=Plasmopara halstedii TaxID=4781 RepID=A0A0P1ABI9_PLAHL|nr:uncharacterized protein PHALS_05832 [Plasmopara halstedii]CEG37776.1 hypothetical protein PHALS_05832 [Plasmopara halstedii]|eukprot:XP_024574145.1 hypothetical protein PHALS_05832 [Plasmopara halstedii]